jgi:hypothetical protein
VKRAGVIAAVAIGIGTVGCLGTLAIVGVGAGVGVPAFFRYQLREGWEDEGEY